MKRETTMNEQDCRRHKFTIIFSFFAARNVLREQSKSIQLKPFQFSTQLEFVNCSTFELFNLIKHINLNGSTQKQNIRKRMTKTRNNGRNKSHQICLQFDLIFQWKIHAFSIDFNAVIIYFDFHSIFFASIFQHLLLLCFDQCCKWHFIVLIEIEIDFDAAADENTKSVDDQITDVNILLPMHCRRAVLQLYVSAFMMTDSKVFQSNESELNCAPIYYFCFVFFVSDKKHIYRILTNRMLKRREKKIEWKWWNSLIRLPHICVTIHWRKKTWTCFFVSFLRFISLLSLGTETNVLL